MKATHFSAGSMCPRGAFALGDSPEMVCHCLAVETKHGVVLVDTGLFADADDAGFRFNRAFSRFMRPTRQSAKRELERLGYRASDVTHVVCTHLDIDHAGGLSDFPDAEVHVMETERAAARARRTFHERGRYVPKHFTHGPKWKTRATGGETWKGFSAVRALHEDEPDLLLVPLHGHTRGHAAVAVRSATGWLLHCGDAYFHHDEMTDEARAPFGFELFQRTVADDDRARRDNQRRLRELKSTHHDVRLFCAHSKHELDQLRGGST